MIFNRVWPRAASPAGSIWKPTPSGPRCRREWVIASSPEGSRPKIPAMPHISAALRDQQLGPVPIGQSVQVHAAARLRDHKPAEARAEEAVLPHQDLALHHVHSAIAVEGWRQLLASWNRLALSGGEAQQPFAIAEIDPMRVVLRR